MKKRHALLFGAVVCGMPCALADAVLIEISFSITGDLLDGNGGTTTDGVVVFDTESPPVKETEHYQVYSPLSGSVYIGSNIEGGATPFSSDAALEHDPSGLTYADLYYGVGTNFFTITLSNEQLSDDGMSTFGGAILFTVESPAGFSPTMDTLPDSPAAYETVGPSAFVSGYSTVPSNGSFSSAYWSPGTGYSGRVWYNVRIVEPEAMGCSLADINMDGEIDFFDISAFLKEYSNGCP